MKTRLIKPEKHIANGFQIIREGRYTVLCEIDGFFDFSGTIVIGRNPNEKFFCNPHDKIFDYLENIMYFIVY